MNSQGHNQNTILRGENERGWNEYDEKVSWIENAEKVSRIETIERNEIENLKQNEFYTTCQV